MKNLFALVSTLFLVSAVSFSSWSTTCLDRTENLFYFEKSKPVYEIDIEKKKIFFIDVEGSYMIDNDHIDVVMEGDINKKNEVVDISTLPKGKYVLEIVHRGFMFADEIVIP